MIEVSRAGIKDHGVVSSILLDFSRELRSRPRVDPDRWDRILAELLNSDRWLFLLAHEDDDPMGIAVTQFFYSLYASLEQARLAALLVQRDCRGRGTGSMLLENAIAAVRRRGCQGLEVCVDPQDTRLIEFFSRFELTGRQLVLRRRL